MAEKTGTSESLTTKQLQFISAVCVQASVAQAAKETGIAEWTGYRWLEDPAFNQEYRRRRRRLVEHAQVMLQHTSSQAVLTLVRNLSGSDAPAAGQIAAAKTILEPAVKAVDLDVRQ